MAKRQPVEALGATLERDLVCKRINGRTLTLDFYRPKEFFGALPVIVWIHGGGWSDGQKTQWNHALSFAGDGYAVASIEYRLSGEAPFPAQIEDCKAVVRWM